VLALALFSVTPLGYSLGMDKRTNYYNTNHYVNNAPAVVAELAGLGLSVDTLYDGVSDQCPCCELVVREVPLAA
jgi:hypothetical protein